MTEALTKKENTVLASKVLSPIIKIIDENKDDFDIERMKESLKAMHEQTSTCAAWPTHETMDKADEMKLTNDLYETIIEMIEIRIKQKELALKHRNSKSVGNAALEAMGLL